MPGDKVYKIYLVPNREYIASSFEYHDYHDISPKKSRFIAFNHHNEFSNFFSLLNVNVNILLFITPCCLNLTVCNKRNCVFEMLSLKCH